MYASWTPVIDLFLCWFSVLNCKHLSIFICFGLLNTGIVLYFSPFSFSSLIEVCIDFRCWWGFDPSIFLVSLTLSRPWYQYSVCVILRFGECVCVSANKNKSNRFPPFGGGGWTIPHLPIVGKCQTSMIWIFHDVNFLQFPRRKTANNKFLLHLRCY